MSIGHSPSQLQHMPDMRKDPNQVSEAEKKDAKRRIQGSGFAEDNSTPSSDSDGMSRALA